jgi:hypothetical protein
VEKTETQARQRFNVPTTERGLHDRRVRFR